MRRQHALLIGIDHYPNLLGADLRGCVNDVRLMRSVLETRFQFEPANIEVLTNAEASRAGILAAFDRLEDRVAPDEGVVIFYAGHGSRMKQADGSWQETLVTADSGRREHANLDLLDTEIDALIQRINAKTRWVTLIFDCCHSGSVTRKTFVDIIEKHTREVRADERSSPASGRPADMPPPAAWPVPRDAVLLAACRADETAREARDPLTNQHHGALTLALAKVLLDLRGAATWRAVVDAIAPRITIDHPKQHPILEGRLDTVAFGYEERHPPQHVRVSQVRDDGLTLSGGAVHGITSGSTWRLTPAVTQGAPVSVEVRSVEAIEARTTRAAVEVGWWAEPERIELAAPQLTLAGEIDEDLAQLIVAERLLTRVSDTEAACVRIESDGVHWTAVGLDGHWAVRRRAHADRAGFIADLVKVARFRGLLTMQFPDQDDLLQDAVHFEIQRTTRAGTALADDGFQEGEKAEFVISNTGDETVYVSLLQFGVDRAIDLLLPIAGHPHDTTGGYVLEAGQTLRLAADYFAADPRFGKSVSAGLPLRLPDGFPWAAEPGLDEREGTIVLRLIVTCQPASFAFTTQRSARTDIEHPLMDMHHLYSSGHGSRSFLPAPTLTRAPEPYAVITRAVRVRRG
jgi:hypothetical protein